MSDAFRWGLLGAGEVARNFGLSVALLPDHRVAAVASRRRDRAAATASVLGVTNVARDYSELVADNSLDAIYVSTPAALHHQHVSLALKAGKPVLCEKPFTVTAEEARDLAALANETSVFLMEAMWTRFIPAVQALKERVAEGEIGKVRMLHAQLGFAAPYDPNNRYFSRALGGGSLLDLGIYPLSLSWFLLGAPEAGMLLTGQEPNGVDARASIILRYPNDALASLSCSFDQRLENRALVTGSLGTLALEAPLFAPERITFTKASRPVETDRKSQFANAWPTSNHPQLVRLRRRYSPLLRQILRREKTMKSYPFLGHGYQFEAAEVASCVRAGHCGSATMPLEETVAIMECLDSLRGSGSFGVIV